MLCNIFMEQRHKDNCDMLITWPHGSVSTSVSEPSPPPSSPPPSRSCRSSRPPTGRISSAGSRQRAFSTRRKQQESIQGGDAGRRLQRRLLPPSCCSKFSFVCFVFFLMYEDDFRFSLKRITSNLECEYISTDAMANFETVFCSNACLQRFGKNQFAL